MAKSIKQSIVNKEERRWQVEDALRTLQKAEAIKKDTKLMNDVKTSISNLQKMAFGGSTPKAKKK